MIYADDPTSFLIASFNQASAAVALIQRGRNTPALWSTFNIDEQNALLTLESRWREVMVRIGDPSGD